LAHLGAFALEVPGTAEQHVVTRVAVDGAPKADIIWALLARVAQESGTTRIGGLDTAGLDGLFGPDIAGIVYRCRWPTLGNCRVIIPASQTRRPLAGRINQGLGKEGKQMGGDYFQVWAVDWLVRDGFNKSPDR
jgi:hypothetical protein